MKLGFHCAHAKSSRVISMKSDKNVYGITGDSKDQITCLCVANAAGEVLPPSRYFLVNNFGIIPWLTAYLVPTLGTLLTDGSIPSYFMVG